MLTTPCLTETSCWAGSNGRLGPPAPWAGPSWMRSSWARDNRPRLADVPRLLLLLVSEPPERRPANLMLTLYVDRSLVSDRIWSSTSGWGNSAFTNRSCAPCLFPTTKPPKSCFPGLCSPLHTASAFLISHCRKSCGFGSNSSKVSTWPYFLTNIGLAHVTLRGSTAKTSTCKPTPPPAESEPWTGRGTRPLIAKDKLAELSPCPVSCKSARASQCSLKPTRCSISPPMPRKGTWNSSMGTELPQESLNLTWNIFAASVEDSS
mmetsp:Transcript_39966/g.101506  ORF Transcript_39966/g.101506 Transcript_39966/m.101506 type:complete len:263 (-) Transcript_39966:61-849(-)